MSALEFSNHFVHNVEVAHQVEAGMLVVQALVLCRAKRHSRAGARGVEDVKRTLATHVEPLGQERSRQIVLLLTSSLSRPLLSKLC